MRTTLIIIGLILCLIAGEILLIDKIVLHEGLLPPAETAAPYDEGGDYRQRHIDLPDSGGFALMAVGIVFLLFSLGLKRFSPKS
jgi:hypothetical protein